MSLKTLDQILMKFDIVIIIIMDLHIVYFGSKKKSSAKRDSMLNLIVFLKLTCICIFSRTRVFSAIPKRNRWHCGRVDYWSIETGKTMSIRPTSHIICLYDGLRFILCLYERTFQVQY